MKKVVILLSLLIALVQPAFAQTSEPSCSGILTGNPKTPKDFVNRVTVVFEGELQNVYVVEAGNKTHYLEAKLKILQLYKGDFALEGDLVTVRLGSCNQLQNLDLEIAENRDKWLVYAHL